MFHIKNGKELTELYLKSDVILLADVFEKFIKLSVNEFDINPLYCVSLPGYTWLCGLKYTGINLQTLQDKDMILLIENNITGGISSIMGDRYIKSDGNSSNNSEQKIDTSLFVQKPYLRTNYIEANIEEDIDLKNQYRIKNVPDPINIREATSKNYVDNSINEVSLVRNNRVNDFSNYNLTNINCITLNKQAENDNEVITKAYVDQFHQENERSRRDVGLDFYNESSDLVKNNQDNDFNDDKLTNINSITVNRNPNLDNEVTNKKYVDDELNKNTILRFNQTLENYLKLSVGNDTYNLTKYNKIQLTDTTIMSAGNSGGYLLQNWNIQCNDKNNNGKISNFIKSTVTRSPTGQSGAESLPPIGTAFMFVETSGNNSGSHIVFCSWERTDLVQISNITFYYNRFSILTDDSRKSMGRFRIQLLLNINIWTTIYTIAKNDQYSVSATDWTLLNLDFTTENYGNKLIYDQIDTAHADMCFSNITITHSVY